VTIGKLQSENPNLPAGEENSFNLVFHHSWIKLFEKSLDFQGKIGII
jgi:hypothetical protein